MTVRWQAASVKGIVVADAVAFEKVKRKEDR